MMMMMLKMMMIMRVLERQDRVLENLLALILQERIWQEYIKTLRVWHIIVRTCFCVCKQTVVKQKTKVYCIYYQRKQCMY
jgi:hypothetical protein